MIVGEKFREVLTATFGLERFCTVPTTLRNRGNQNRYETENKTEAGLNLSTATTLGLRNHLLSPMPGSTLNHLLPPEEMNSFRKKTYTTRFKDCNHLDRDDEMVMIVTTESTC